MPADQRASLIGALRCQSASPSLTTRYSKTSRESPDHRSTNRNSIHLNGSDLSGSTACSSLAKAAKHESLVQEQLVNEIHYLRATLETLKCQLNISLTDNEQLLTRVEELERSNDDLQRGMVAQSSFRKVRIDVSADKSSQLVRLQHDKDAETAHFEDTIERLYLEIDDLRKANKHLNQELEGKRKNVDCLEELVLRLEQEKSTLAEAAKLLETRANQADRRIALMASHHEEEMASLRRRYQDLETRHDRLLRQIADDRQRPALRSSGSEPARLSRRKPVVLNRESMALPEPFVLSARSIQTLNSLANSTGSSDVDEWKKQMATITLPSRPQSQLHNEQSLDAELGNDTYNERTNTAVSSRRSEVVSLILSNSYVQSRAGSSGDRRQSTVRPVSAQHSDSVSVSLVSIHKGWESDSDKEEGNGIDRCQSSTPAILSRQAARLSDRLSQCTLRRTRSDSSSHIRPSIIVSSIVGQTPMEIQHCPTVQNIPAQVTRCGTPESETSLASIKFRSNALRMKSASPTRSETITQKHSSLDQITNASVPLARSHSPSYTDRTTRTVSPVPLSIPSRSLSLMREQRLSTRGKSDLSSMLSGEVYDKIQPVPPLNNRQELIDILKQPPPPAIRPISADTSSAGSALGRSNTSVHEELSSKIAMCVIGTEMYKYVRTPKKSIFGSLKRRPQEEQANRHKRYVALKSTEVAVCWSVNNPIGMALGVKKAVIDEIHDVEDNAPIPLNVRMHDRSIVILSSGTAYKFTCKDAETHSTWYEVISHLLSIRRIDFEEASMAVGSFDPIPMPQKVTAKRSLSFTSRRTARPKPIPRKKPSMPDLHTEPVPKIDSESMERLTLPRKHQAYRSGKLRPLKSAGGTTITSGSNSSKSPVDRQPSSRLPSAAGGHEKVLAAFVSADDEDE